MEELDKRISEIVRSTVKEFMESLLRGEILVYCFSQFWTIYEKNYEMVPAVSPPFRSFIFLSLLNILAFSIFDSLILRSSSGFPL